MLSLDVSSSDSTDSILKLSFEPIDSSLDSDRVEAELELIISEDADLPKLPPVKTDVGQFDPAGIILSLYKKELPHGLFERQSLLFLLNRLGLL